MLLIQIFVVATKSGCKVTAFLVNKQIFPSFFQKYLIMDGFQVSFHLNQGVCVEMHTHTSLCIKIPGALNTGRENVKRWERERHSLPPNAILSKCPIWGPYKYTLPLMV